jgi:hypothetical protein
MAHSFSNLHTGLVLHVSLMGAYKDGKSPTLSITLPGFPEGKEESRFLGSDQQLIDLESIMVEYLSSPEAFSGEKLTVAAYFDALASRLRESARQHELDEE